MAFTIRTAMIAMGSNKWGWVAACAAAACVAAAMPGCELLVDFDRSKIPDEGGLADATTPGEESASPESSAEDTSTGDAGDAGAGDGATDAPADGPSDSALESATDAADDGATEAGDDGATDAADAGDAP
jgi:hypothetical protein